MFLFKYIDIQIHESMERIQITRDQQLAIDDYLEYKRIVGDDDGGVPFTPEQYEAYKKKVIPMRMANRIYISWTNPRGMDCILPGPQTECFCQHRLVAHKTDFEELPKTRPIKIPCLAAGCKCQSFHVMVKMSGQPTRCHCKHIATDHATNEPYICTARNCKCSGFKTSFTCDCGLPAHQHEMIMETKQERLARGHPIGQDNPYKAMGGITGFSSLAAGYERLDPSGVGAPSEEWLNQPITSDDHPFLRMHVDAIHQYKMANNDIQGAMIDNEERMSAMRRPGESELDYYERRYQEREKKKYTGAASRRIEPSSKPIVKGVRKPLE